jgi:septum site-determining protein MinC
MGEPSSGIQIKGIRDGLLITLSGLPWPDLVTVFVTTIDERPAFFQGGKVAVDVGGQELRVAELSSLRDKLSERGITLWAILSESKVTERNAQNLGMATRITKPRPAEAVRAAEKSGSDTAKWIKGPVRSGVQVVHDGNVIVMGDLNSGAEIVAGGSIIVWGRLRGVVHAGANGDIGAVVCALELSPTQLRIANVIAVSPKKPEKSHPEVVFLENGNLTAKPWNEHTGR